jgi:hypothetical protein
LMNNGDKKNLASRDNAGKKTPKKKLTLGLHRKTAALHSV